MVTGASLMKWPSDEFRWTHKSTSPLALMYDVPVSFSIYMKQVTQVIDVPIVVADKSPGLDLLKTKVNGSVVINLAVNSMPMLFFGKCPGRHRLKTLEPSSAAGSHFHYSDVIMSAMVSNHWRLVCPTACSGTDQRKHQSSASLASVRGIHRWPVNSLHKGPVTWKMFPFDDVACSLYSEYPLKNVCSV